MGNLFKFKNSDYVNLITYALKKHNTILASRNNEEALSLAEAYSRYCLCLNSNGLYYCNSCKSCRMLDKNMHPDYMFVDIEGSSIGVDRIRLLSSFIHTKNSIGSNSIIVINNSDKLTINAANALLKPLEDKPAYLIFILVVRKFKSLIQTLLSRCSNKFLIQGDIVTSSINGDRIFNELDNLVNDALFKVVSEYKIESKIKAIIALYDLPKVKTLESIIEILSLRILDKSYKLALEDLCVIADFIDTLSILRSNMKHLGNNYDIPAFISRNIIKLNSACDK